LFSRGRLLVQRDEKGQTDEEDDEGNEEVTVG